MPSGDPDYGATIRDWIDKAEDSAFKRCAYLPPTEAFATLIASFANSAGGTIVLGVGSNRTIAGIDMDQVKARLQAALDLMLPTPAVQIQDGLVRSTVLVALTVQPSKEPVAVRGHVVYRRGTSIEPMTYGLMMKRFGISDRLSGASGERTIHPEETVRFAETHFRPPVSAFVAYKWESEQHNAWVMRFAEDLRRLGVEAILDQWEVRLGDSFTDYMQRHIARADVLLFVITPGSVAAAEAPQGQGGALKFEVQMMNARRIAEGTRIIGIYRAGDRSPNYLRDHRYADFRNDALYESSLQVLVDDLLGRTRPPEIGRL